MGRTRGFTQFELVVCLTLILLLGFGGYLRYMALVVDAERAAFQGVMGWLQAGINLEMGRALVRGDLGELSVLEGRNPMELVTRVMTPPSNYLGALSGEAAAAAEPGNWYYDSERALLVYRVKYEANLEGFRRAPDRRLAFRLKVVYQPADNRGYRRVRGLKLEAVDAGFRRTPLAWGRQDN